MVKKKKELRVKKQVFTAKCEYCGELFQDTAFGVLCNGIMQQKVACNKAKCIQAFQKEYNIQVDNG